MMIEKFCIICILTLGVIGCRNKKYPIKLSLVNVYVEDTLYYKTLSYKIKITNTNSHAISLFFKKEKSYLKKYDEEPDKNISIILYNSSRQKKCELSLSYLFPGEVIIKENSNINLAFFSNCDDFICSSKSGDDKFQFRKKLSDLIKNDNHLYCYLRNSERIDSIPILVDNNFDIKFRNIFINDLNN
jgi:hypothetical protein